VRKSIDIANAEYCKSNKVENINTVFCPPVVTEQYKETTDEHQIIATFYKQATSLA